MSLIEETSKTAQVAINALNSVPVLLALVMLQFFMLGSLLYLSIKRDEYTHTRFLALIERCVPDADKRSDLMKEFRP
jgi:hypothetical protein